MVEFHRYRLFEAVKSKIKVRAQAVFSRSINKKRRRHAALSVTEINSCIRKKESMQTLQLKVFVFQFVARLEMILLSFTRVAGF